MKDFKIVYVTRPADSPEMVNAVALGMLGLAPDLARRLNVDLDHVEMTVRTKRGDTITVRLERNEEFR